MSPAFIKGLEQVLPNSKIVFDKFDVVKIVNTALDCVRRREAKVNPLLRGSRFTFLKNKNNLTKGQNINLENLSKLNCQTVRAYNIKQTFQDIMNLHIPKNEAELLIKNWCGWCDRSRIPEMRKVSKTVKKHLRGILNYFDSRSTSAFLESINGRIQNIRRRARGFSNINNLKH